MDDNLEKVAEAPQEGSIWELVRFAIIALLIILPLRFFVAQPFIVSGSSMFPTFEDKNYLIVDELSYRLGEPERQDVIIFRYPYDTKKFYIKRIIGLPGESIEISGNEVTITQVNGEKITLHEPYVDNTSPSSKKTWTLKDNEYFVMGDNRAASSDSRSWGPVPENLIEGRAFLRLWPLQDADVMPGDYKETNS